MAENKMDSNEKEGENKRDNLIKFLDMQHYRLKNHGDKMWDEIKHFSWVLYILLGAAPLLKFSWIIDQRGFNPLWIKIWPFFAMIVAAIAILSIYNESRQFENVRDIVIRIEKDLDFNYDFDRDKNPLFNTTRGYSILYFIMLLAIGFIELLFIN